jgi:DNA polymerase-3 subunit alpha
MAVVPIHNHSEFSALDGFSTVEEIASRIEQIGSPGAFITDHGVVAGWRSFQSAMNKRNLQPGFGIEAYQAAVHRTARPEEKKKSRDQHHLVLLAKNKTGIENLMRINDEANRTGFYFVPRVDWELLEKYHEGVIATSACLAGLVAKGIAKDDRSDLYKYLDIFKEDFYIELHTYDDEYQREVNKELVTIANQHGVPLVYANDAHYSCASDYGHHEVMLCMQTGAKITDEKRMSHPQCLYIMDENDVQGSLSYLDSSVVQESICNSFNILESCKDARLPEPKMHLPVYVPREATQDKSNNHLIVRLVEEGLNDRFPEITPEIEDRAAYELETIIEAGLADYFLITADFCNWADDSGIERGPGRGSAGGSLVAYALGITDVDPLKYNLYFERFYNAGRDEGLPDIDIDFEPERRTEVDEYLKSRYGTHQVIPIGNHIRMKPKMTIDRVSKALGIPFGDAEAIKKIIDTIPDINIISADQIGWEPGPGIKIAVLEDPDAAQRLQPYMDKHPELFEHAKAIGGRLVTYGVHASAIVISDVDIRGVLPTMFRASDDGTKGKKVLATQVEMREVEDMGFPKFDRLGLRNLSTLKSVVDLTGGDWSYKDIDWDSLPEDFWQLIESGFTLGLFQVEDGNAKKIGKKLKPRSIEDLAAIVALNRPGPLRSGVVERFIARRNEEEPVVYPHEILRDILRETYGDFLYQEQVIAYFRAIGYDMKEADGIRKMLGKKLVIEMEKEYPRYLERASQFMDEKIAKSIWDLIADFSKYSFNKSHAVAYAIILARTMYAKWKHPIEFIMSSIQTNPADVGSYIREASMMGIKINAPDINMSDVEIAQKDGQIWFGLKNIKWIGEEAAKWVVDNRPFENIEDFRNKHALAQKDWEKNKKGKSPRQMLRSSQIDTLISAGAFDRTDPREYDLMEEAENQKELFGFAIVDPNQSIVEKHRSRLESLTAYDELEHMLGSSAEIPGIITEVKEVKTKTGASMGRVKIEWEGAEAEFAVFGASRWDNRDRWAEYKSWLLKPMTVGVFYVKIGERGLVLQSGEKIS